MRGSFKIGEIAGIGVFVHWTFALLLVFVGLRQMGQPHFAQAVVFDLLLMLSLFGCVVLHELGHALAARRFNISTRDITLLPIGGVARLERMPEQPSQELWVAIAGPLVNVAIASVLAVVLWLRGELADAASLEGEKLFGQTFLVSLLAVNVFMVVFNMLPAFPMDGGRVLRAILATRMSHVRATQIAANVGQVMAMLFGLLGLFTGQFMLMFVALFVYIGAQEESRMVLMRSIFRGVPVREAMMTRFRALSENDTLATASDELLAGAQEDFPVMEGDRIIGLLPRSDVLKALAERGPTARVGECMRRDCGQIDEGEMLDKAFERMQEHSCPLLPVMRAGKLVGLLTLANVGEWSMIHSALQNAGPRDQFPNLFRQPAG